MVETWQKVKTTLRFILPFTAGYKETLKSIVSYLNFK